MTADRIDRSLISLMSLRQLRTKLMVVTVPCHVNGALAGDAPVYGAGSPVTTAVYGDPVVKTFVVARK